MEKREEAEQTEKEAHNLSRERVWVACLTFLSRLLLVGLWMQNKKSFKAFLDLVCGWLNLCVLGVIIEKHETDTHTYTHTQTQNIENVIK